jgi:thiamine biosynthesis protein ThiC
VEVVTLIYRFLRSGAAVGDTLRAGRLEAASDRRATTAEVKRASSEVERAWDATHSAIALRRAPTGGRT